MRRDSPAAAPRSSRRSTRTASIDEPSLRALVDWQIDEGIHFLVPCGSTGEAATMTPAEHRRVVEITVEQARGRVPIVAGAGSNDTREGDRALEGDEGRRRDAPAARRRRCTTSRRSAASSRTFERSPTRSTCRSSSTTCPAARGATSRRRRRSSWRRSRSIVAVKEASGNLAQITDILRERPDELLRAVRRRRDDARRDGRSAATASSPSCRMRRRRLMARAVRRCASSGDAAARAQAPSRADALDARRLRRIESDSGEGRAGDAGQDRRTCCGCRSCRWTRSTPTSVRARAQHAEPRERAVA